MEYPTRKQIFMTLKSNYAILIAIGLTARIFTLIFTYIQISYTFFGNFAMGDVYFNFYDIDSIFTGEWKWNQNDLAYPPLTIYFLLFLRISAFNNVYIFFFYAFILEIITLVLVYSVLNRFNVDHAKVIFGLLFVNPLYFFSYVSRFFTSGFKITDSFFCMILLLALYFYPKEDKKCFYFFLGLSMCAKWYTLPAFPLFIIKYWREKQWEELKKFILFTIIPIFIFLISPLLYLPNYINLYINWVVTGNPLTEIVPIYLKIIPFLILFFIVLYKIKEVDKMTLTFLSIVTTLSYILWSRFYIRYFTPLLFYGFLFYYKNPSLNKENRENLAIKTHCNLFLISILFGTISALISILELWFWYTIF